VSRWDNSFPCECISLSINIPFCLTLYSCAHQSINNIVWGISNDAWIAKFCRLFVSDCLPCIVDWCVSICSRHHPIHAHRLFYSSPSSYKLTHSHSLVYTQNESLWSLSIILIHFNCSHTLTLTHTHIQWYWHWKVLIHTHVHSDTHSHTKQHICIDVSTSWRIAPLLLPSPIQILHSWVLPPLHSSPLLVSPIISLSHTHALTCTHLFMHIIIDSLIVFSSNSPYITVMVIQLGTNTWILWYLLHTPSNKCYSSLLY
jgi:hypothetical protein